LPKKRKSNRKWGKHGKRGRGEEWVARGQLNHVKKGGDRKGGGRIFGRSAEERGGSREKPIERIYEPQGIQGETGTWKTKETKISKKPAVSSLAGVGALVKNTKTGKKGKINRAQ